MEFFIRQNATDPALKLKVVDDGRNDRSTIFDSLESSSISFSMYEIKTKKPIVLNSPGTLAIRKERLNQEIPEYVIFYRFTEDDTSKTGRYEGIFTIRFMDTDLNTTSKLIAPIKEKLFINVI